MEPSRYFSTAKAGTSFNAVEFFRQPVEILRLIGILFAIIVFGCVASGGKTHDHICIFKGESTACNYAVGIGVVAFLGSLSLLVAYAMFNRIASINKRRQVVICDLGFSGLWTFLWFVGFCVLTNKWTTTSAKFLQTHKVEGWQENNARSAIVFSFASIGIWAGLTFIALQRFRLGPAGLGADDGLESMEAGHPGAGGPDMSAGGPIYTTDPSVGQTTGGGPIGGGGPGGQYYTPTY